MLRELECIRLIRVSIVLLAELMIGLLRLLQREPQAEISPIIPCTGVEGMQYDGRLIVGHERGGHGRVVTLYSEIPLDVLIKRIKSG